MKQWDRLFLDAYHEFVGIFSVDGKNLKGILKFYPDEKIELLIFDNKPTFRNIVKEYINGRIKGKTITCIGCGSIRIDSETTTYQIHEVIIGCKTNDFNLKRFSGLYLKYRLLESWLAVSPFVIEEGLAIEWSCKFIPLRSIEVISKGPIQISIKSTDTVYSGNQLPDYSVYFDIKFNRCKSFLELNQTIESLNRLMYLLTRQDCRPISCEYIYRSQPCSILYIEQIEKRPTHYSTFIAPYCVNQKYYDIRTIFKKWFLLDNNNELKPIMDFFTVPIDNSSSTLNYFSQIQALHNYIAKYVLCKKDANFTELMTPAISLCRQNFPELIDELRRITNLGSGDADEKLSKKLQNERDYIAHGMHSFNRVKNYDPMEDHIRDQISFILYIILYSLILNKIGFDQTYINNRFREHIVFSKYLRRNAESEKWFNNFYMELLSKCNLNISVPTSGLLKMYK